MTSLWCILASDESSLPAAGNFPVFKEFLGMRLVGGVVAYWYSCVLHMIREIVISPAAEIPKSHQTSNLESPKIRLGSVTSRLHACSLLLPVTTRLGFAS